VPVVLCMVGMASYFSGTNALASVSGNSTIPSSSPDPSQHARAAAQPAAPGAVTITFSEYPVGTVITTQYAATDGIVFQGDNAGDTQFISNDGANPDSPELSGTPLFAGDVGGRFVEPGTNDPATVDSVSMDVGYIDNPGSTEANAYDANGKLLGSVVANQTGWNHLTLAFSGIASFTVTSTSNEEAGFGVDNVSFVPPRQIAVSSVTVRIQGAGPTAGFGAAPGTGLPADVIADQVHAAAMTINQFPACGSDGDAQWVDCSPAFPDGTPEKVWPVVFERGTKVTLSQVQLKVKDPTINLPGSVITGTATVGATTLTFTSGQVSPVNGVFTVSDLTSDTTLPDEVNSEPMTIAWTVQHGTTTFGAGTSTIPVYLTFGTPNFDPYLSLEALTATAAAGQSSESGVFNSIWTNVFSAQGQAALHIHPQHLNPVTGAVTADSNDTLQYWVPWTLASDYIALDPPVPASCQPQSTAGLLENLIARCYSWAHFMADTMAVQGINTVHAEVINNSPSVPGTFPALPSVTLPRGVTFDGTFMLIKDWTWTTLATGKDPNYQYVTTDTVKLVLDHDSELVPIPNTGALGSTSEFNDLPGVPGQNDANPPGWFSYGFDPRTDRFVADHVIDVYNNMIYDPSYGQGPFANVGAWANNALAGFAYVTYTDHRDAAGNLYRTYTLYGHKGLP
jgi:hypothetical protein